jgi:uncharacterized protein YkwD
MKRYVIILITLIVVALAGAGLYWRFKPHTAPVSEVSGTQVAEVPKCTLGPAPASLTDQSIIDSFNKARAEKGVKPLVYNARLDSYANQRAAEQNGQLDNHAGLKGGADIMGYAMGEVQLRTRTCSTADEIRNSFSVSAPHWSAINNPKYDIVGVGNVNGVLNVVFGDL